MNPVKILVEGKLDKKKGIAHSSDSRFLRDCVQHWFNIDLDLVNNFEYIGGASELREMAIPIRRLQEEDLIHEVLVIVDANGDVAKRKAEVERFQQESGLSFRFFLFPDNSTNGEVETLIEAVATQRKFIDCFNDYERCIGKPLDLKDKVFAYIAAASKNHDDAKDINRKFSADLFNLDHAALNPLKEFLSPFFQ